MTQSKRASFVEALVSIVRSLRLAIFWMRGATAYEWQIGRLRGRVTHLDGDHWRWKPWRRISINWDTQS